MATAIAPPEVRNEAGPTRGALPVLLAGVFTSLLDFFIVNVALPDTQRDLHAGPSAVQFIVAGDGLAVAAGLITAGRLGDTYGRRKMYVLGLALFTVASAACGPAGPRGTRLAVHLPDQHPGRRGGRGAGAAAAPGVPGTRRRPDRPRRHRAGLTRPRRHRLAARRGAAAGLACLGLPLPGRLRPRGRRPGPVPPPHRVVHRACPRPVSGATGGGTNPCTGLTSDPGAAP